MNKTSKLVELNHKVTFICPSHMFVMCKQEIYSSNVQACTTASLAVSWCPSQFLGLCLFVPSDRWLPDLSGPQHLVTTLLVCFGESTFLDVTCKWDYVIFNIQHLCLFNIEFSGSHILLHMTWFLFLRLTVHSWYIVLHFVIHLSLVDT